MVTVVTAVIFRPLMIKYPTERENLKVASQSTLNSQTIYSMTFTINHNSTYTLLPNLVRLLSPRIGLCLHHSRHTQNSQFL